MRRLLRLVGFLVTFALLLAFAAYLLRGPLFGRLVAERVERELSARLGGRFSVERVEGSYLFDLAIVGLRTEEAPPGPLRRLDCRHAVLEYDLRRLLKGDLDAIRAVLASDADVEIDVDRSEGASGAGASTELPRRLPRLELHGRLTVRTQFGEVRAEGLSVNTLGHEKLGVRVFSLVVPPRFGPSAPFAGTLERTGPSVFVLTSDTPVAGVTPVHATYDGALEAQILVGGSAGTLELAGGEARFTSDALDLARLPAWVWPLGIEPPTEAVASVQAAATLRPLLVEATATTPRVRWRDLDLSDVRVHLRHDENRTVIVEAHAEGRGALVNARDVVLDPKLPWLVGDVGEAEVTVRDLRAVEPRLDRPLSLSLKARRASGGGFAIEDARVEGEGIALKGRGAVVPPDDPARWRDATLSATYEGTVRDLASKGYAFAGELRISGEVSGTLAAPEASARVEGEGLTVEGKRVDRVLLSARVAPPFLRIDDLRVEAEAGTLLAKGEVDLAARALLDGSYEIDVPDLRAFLRLFPWAPEAQGTLTGSARLAGDDREVSGTCTLRGHDIVLAGRPIGEVQATARLTRNGAIVEDAVARGPWGEAAGRGSIRWDEATAEVRSLRIDAGPVQASLVDPFRVSWDEDGARTGALDFLALGGSVRGVASVKGGRLEASLRGEGLDLSRLDPRLEGSMTAGIRVDGDTFVLDVAAPEARYGGRVADVRLWARSGLDGIRVEKLVVKSGDGFSAEGTATLPWRFDGTRFERIETVDAELAFDARVPAFGKGGVRAGGATVTVRGKGRELTATARVRDLSADGAGLLGEALVEVLASPSKVTASAVLERSALGEAEAHMSADRGFDWTEPTATLQEAGVAGEIRLRISDLGTLRKFTSGLAALEGEADGTLSVAGTLARPTLTGRLHLAGVGVRTDSSGPRLSRGQGELVLEGRTVRVESFTGEMGYVPVEAKGTIDLEDPFAPRFDLKLLGKNALLVNDPTLRVRADVDLALTGEPSALKLTGKARITDALYTRPINMLSRGERAVSEELSLFHVRRGPLADAALDVDVSADKSIRIRTPTVRGDLSCDLRVRGTGAAPAPEGRVFFQDLLVEIQSVMGLKADRGEIDFPEGEPFDPKLEVAAHTRLKGYDIDVQLSGRVADLELLVTTRPALSQDDAILLLVTGYTRDELEREGIERAALEKLAVFLGERLVSKVSGPRDPDERSFLDRFQFKVGKDVSRSGDSTIEAEFEASDHLFLRVERDRFDDYNGGIVWRIRLR